MGVEHWFSWPYSTSQDLPLGKWTYVCMVTAEQKGIVTSRLPSKLNDLYRYQP